MTIDETIRAAVEEIDRLYTECAENDDPRPAARAILARHFAGQGWQPIETAPKGGGAELVTDPAWAEPPRILAAWSPVAGLLIVYWDYYAEDGGGYEQGQTGWVNGGEGALSINDAPTHWQPLPPPPTHKEGTDDAT